MYLLVKPRSSATTLLLITQENVKSYERLCQVLVRDLESHSTNQLVLHWVQW